jgi:hypothetical protein
MSSGEIHRETREVLTKSASPETMMEVTVRHIDLVHIATDLRAVCKSKRRWVSLVAAAATGVAITALAAGVAGLVHDSAPLPLRVGYFCVAGGAAVLAAILYKIDNDLWEDPCRPSSGWSPGWSN